MGKPKKRIYIVGGSNGKELCPWDAERWGCNATCIGFPVDVSFHLHDLMHPERYYMTGTNQKKQAEFMPFLAYIQLRNHPVFSVKIYEGFPMIQRYPYEEVCDFFQTNYFSNSICYMIALALYKGYEEIHTYGVNLIFASEYQHERPGLEYWIGRANQMGLRLGKEFRIIGDMNTLFNLPVKGQNYAFEDKLWYEPEPVPRYDPIPWHTIGERAI